MKGGFNHSRTVTIRGTRRMRGTRWSKNIKGGTRSKSRKCKICTQKLWPF